MHVVNQYNTNLHTCIWLVMYVKLLACNCRTEWNTLNLNIALSFDSLVVSFRHCIID